jgi:predicted choloylglycine hydrolase
MFRPEREPDLTRLPEWVRSLGLPREATDAIDRWWSPVWSVLQDELELMPELGPAARPGEGAAAAEELVFEAVEELEPGPKWQARLRAMWPAYRQWYLQQGEDARPGLETCRAALERHMPELLRTYERLVELADGDELTARMLSLYRPPGFVVGCSQGAWTRSGPVLVRNYDYPASRLEGVISSTAWTGRRVIGMSDCLWGLLDGINDDGLAASLTFGGRKDVGDGFGIPIVMRYLLETCATVEDARRVLARIPVHAAQNVTVVDRSGDVLTAYVGPGRPPEFTHAAATTNHQGHVEWPEYANAIRSVEREERVLGLLADPDLAADGFVDAFLAPPLHSTSHAQGFGTVYTAAYFPAEGAAEYRWPGSPPWRQSLTRFAEGTRTITYAGSSAPGGR